MKREIILPKNEKEWLNLREQDITSTMSAAVFGMSPYLTALELYLSKAEDLKIDFIEHDRIAKGRRIEEYAAQEVALDQDWMVEPFNEYIRLPEYKLGSSFDYLIHTKDGKKGILEIKAVDYGQYKEKWSQNEAPEHIEVQVQHQLLVAGEEYDFVAIAAFHSIYDFALIIREPDHEMQDNILKACNEFWQRIENKSAPKPDYSRDLDILKKSHEGNQSYDGMKDDKLRKLLWELDSAKKAVKDFTDAKEKLEAYLFDYLKDYKEAWTEDFKWSISNVKDTPPTIIEVTQDMVGETITYGGRKGYKRVNLKKLKKG